MSPIEFAILLCGVLALVFLILALCWMMKEMQALKADVAGLTDIVERLVSDRVDDVVNAGCRSLNEVGP
jgi:hypothetical protein